MNETLTQKKIKQYYKETDESYSNWGSNTRSGADSVYNIHYGYSDSAEQGHLESLTNMNRELSQEAEIQSGDHVLDAGCGVGASSSWLNKNIGAKVHGVSLSKHQVRKAKKFTRNLTDIDFSEQDFTNTKFKDSTFDVVWGLESICYADDKNDFIKEAYRILKKGGRLVVGDFFLTKSKLNKIERYSLDLWLEGWVMPNLDTIKNFQSNMKKSKFKEVNARDITKNVLNSAEEIYKRGKGGYPDDILGKSKNVSQIKHVQACLFQKVTLDMGLWKYIIFSGTK